MKKGQMEILGFMVIILIIIVGIIFYIKLSPEDSTIENIQDIERNLEVANMLSSLKLQSICEGEQMVDVIKACTKDEFICSEKACDILTKQLPIIIEAYGWEKDTYMFTIDDKLYTNECQGLKEPADSIISGKIVRLTYCY